VHHVAACFIKCNNADALMAAVRNDHVDRIRPLAELVDVDFTMGFYTPLTCVRACMCVRARARA
jgi:hypothetical protein